MKPGQILVSALFLSSIASVAAAETSADYRANLKTSVYFMPLSLSSSDTSYFMAGNGGGLRWNFDEEHQLDASYLLSGTGGGQFTAKLATARFRWFLGNSFNLSAGLAYQSLNWDMKKTHHGLFSSWDFDYNGPLLKYKTDILYASGALGNQWQISNFTIGANWLSLNLPLSLDRNRIESRGETDEANRSYRRRGDRVARKTVIFYPQLTLGFSF